MFTNKLLSRTFSIVIVWMLILSSSHPALAVGSNDNFADATPITSLPYSTNADNVGATFESGEPTPNCGYGYNVSTVWYSYTPSVDITLTAKANYSNFPPVLAIYMSSLGNLIPITCGTWNPQLTFQAQPNVTYYFQLDSYYPWDQGTIPFTLEVTPPPVVNFNYYPSDPNTFDNVSFNPYADDPGNIGVSSFAWTSSDGGTSNQYYFNHQFASDGDYTVSLLGTTGDGRSGSAIQVIHVRTKDVAITSFSIPQTARVNQTKTINVNIQNKRYSDYVAVTLIKGLPGGAEQQIGTLTIYVPAKAKQVTTFKFSYTFTADDATVGKVTFKAVANIVNGRDALPTDNTAIATTLVSK